MTLKQQKLLKNISTSKTLREAGTKAGYSRLSQKMYDPKIKRKITEVLKIDKDEVLRRFNECYNLALSKEDITNMARTNEALARINGMFLDRTKEEGTPSHIIISYDKPKPTIDKDLQQKV